MLGNVKTFIIYILNIFLLVAGISGILYFTAHYKATETAEITGTKNNNDAVILSDEDMDDESKDNLTGNDVVMEIMTMPTDVSITDPDTGKITTQKTRIEINGIVISNLTAVDTNDNYVEYAQKYGNTQMIAQKISVSASYKKTNILDGHGNIIGVTYTTV